MGRATESRVIVIGDFNGERKLAWANRVRRLITLTKEGSIKDFYKEVNRMTKIKVGFPPVKGIIESGGKIIMEEEDVNRKIAEYYEGIFHKEEEKMEVGQDQEMRDIFTSEEVAEAIQQCNF